MIRPSTLSCHDFPSTMIEIHEVVKIQIHAILKEWLHALKSGGTYNGPFNVYNQIWIGPLMYEVYTQNWKLRSQFAMPIEYGLLLPNQKSFTVPFKQKPLPIRYSRDYIYFGGHILQRRFVALRDPKKLVVIKWQGIRPYVKVCVL